MTDEEDDPRISDSTSTQVLSDELTVDGDLFAWWAVGNGPALVTVSHPILGKKADFTGGDPKQFAITLAKALLKSQS